MLALGDAFHPDTLYLENRRDELWTQPSVDNPVGSEGVIGGVLPAHRLWEMLAAAGSTFIVVSSFTSVASLILRLRRARGDERQQLKWFVYAATLMVGGFVVSLPASFSPLTNEIAFTFAFLGFLLLPVFMVIAILKYRLYDIDRIINRTLVYSALTVALAAVYVGVVVVLQAAFRALALGESQLAVVALFGPLRRRMQEFIDRRFYRKKYDAAKTLAAFSARLRDETDLERLEPELLAVVVRETLQPAHVSLWLREPEKRDGKFS